MILYTVIVALMFFRYTGAQDDLSEIQITPDFDLVKKTGESVTLTCRFTTDDISNVKWIGPDKAEIPLGSSQKRNVEVVTDGVVVLELRDLSLDDDVVYRCRGFSAAANQTIESSKKVTVYAPVKFINTPEEQEFNIGQSVSVVCSAIGTPQPKIIWLQNGSKIEISSNEKYFQDEDSSNLGIRNISKDDEGTYVCKARELSTGEVTEREIKVVVNIPPKIENFKPEFTLTEGKAEVLICHATGDPAPTYSWYRGDGTGGDELLSSGSALNLSITRDMDMKYRCVAVNKAGTDSATLTLAVNVRPVFTIMEGDSVTEKDQATLKCVAEGIPTPTVFIYRDDIMLPDNTDDAETSDDNDTFALGSWKSNSIVNYTRNEATILFSYTEFSDAGRYECRATNDAGYEETDLMLEVKYVPRALDMENVWACDVDYAQLTCEFDAWPSPELTWGRFLPSEGSSKNDTSNYIAFNTSNPPDGISFESTGSILSLIIETSVFEDPWGTYVCSAENSIGSSNTTAEVKRATLPRAPFGVQVKGVKTREAIVYFTPFEPPLVPYLSFTIRLEPAAFDVKTVTVNLEPSVTDYKFTDLEHDTEYTVLVEANNCAGPSDVSGASEIRTFKTVEIENPDSVEIISGKASEEHDRYTVQWRPRDVGGGEIKNITITLYKVGEDIDGKNTTKIKTYVPSDREMENGSYVIEDLNPTTAYEISVEIYNEVGSASVMKQFITNISPSSVNLTDSTEISWRRDEPPTPTTTGATTEDSSFMMGSVDTKLIIIIIVVLLVLILVVDITCCLTRSWGLTYWIFAHTCKKSKKHNIEAAEEGSAEYRQEHQGNYKKAVVETADAGNVDVEEEKRPLAEDVEPIANGELGKLTPIDEQTLLETPGAAAAQVVSENGKVEGAREQEEENAEKTEELNEQPSAEEEKLVQNTEQDAC